MSNLTGFQKYLVDKGFKRFYTDNNGQEIENYNSEFLTAIGRMFYEFKKDNKYCYWGLKEYGKPPVMFLGKDKMQGKLGEGEMKTCEDMYRILFSKWKEDKFDEIYEVFMSDNKKFLIDCIDEKNVSIEVINN